MNTCDYKNGCRTQKHEACKDAWNPAVKLGNSRNGTSITWILVNMGWFFTGHAVDLSSLLPDMRIWMDEHCSKSNHWAPFVR